MKSWRFERADMARSIISREITGSGLATDETILSGHFERGRKATFPLHHFRSHAPGKLLRALDRTVGNSQPRNAAIAQMADHLFAGRSRPQNQRRMPAQAPKNLLGQLHSGKRHRNRPLTAMVISFLSVRRRPLRGRR